ncbi:hypothetical protein ZHAS_00015600 [Anopheles sinensis]|uniref:Uncharacterized protein n=1 Tax=Anopheles sinensis TaxID=74873 RepID=A0A084WAW4_ANOSI|nr:hypothetical protein ZHAS_00015600 [Anopheles sinensis]
MIQQVLALGQPDSRCVAETSEVKSSGLSRGCLVKHQQQTEFDLESDLQPLSIDQILSTTVTGGRSCTRPRNRSPTGPEGSDVKG